MRITRWVTATAAAVLTGAVLGLTACGSSPATATHAVAAQSVCAQISAWTANGGLVNNTTVATDLSQTQQDAAAGDLVTLETVDGPQLVMDAGDALANPMPGGTSYATAMADIVQAGTDISAGDIAGATAQLIPADVALSAATTTVENCDS